LPVGLHLLPEGDALVYGFIVDSLSLKRNAFIMYVNEDGELVSTKEILVDIPFRIHNQPGMPLVIHNPEAIDCKIQLFSINGQYVLDQPLQEGLNEIEDNELPSGLYTFVISDKHRHLYSGKWVKM
jgi:hypothetical protein